MKIKVLTAYPNAIWGTHAAEWLSAAAALDVHGVHTLTEDPEAADAILLMEGTRGRTCSWKRCCGIRCAAATLTRHSSITTGTTPSR